MARTTADLIVTVWLDNESGGHGWIVDTDSPNGGESDTLKVFPPTDAGFEAACRFAAKAARKRGCRAVASNGVSGLPLYTPGE